MGSSRPESNSVQKAAGLCAPLFGRCFSSTNLGSAAKEELLNEQGGLKIWAGNIGIFATGTASADYRLRNDPNIKEAMVSMLVADLKEDYGEGGTADKEGSQKSTSSSEASLVVDLDEEETSNNAGTSLSGSAVQNLIETCKVTITNLTAFLSPLRSLFSYNENAKVTRFIQKEKGKTEQHGGEDIISEFLVHIKWLFSFRYRQISPNIAERLIDALVFRRKKLIYCQRHQEKLQHGMGDAFVLPFDEAI
ncbi:hypothetical protein TSTA_011840 [Talaromyces stipitatus ATCC 10500]|uniref:Uncharacterized protein n=1 Tax=Talaromyces stipitatus (strain ATCC 10500 / CBS 375.48 / QM 6759 / NRRL 1006) TaxID=441959 RepID=B8MDZ8_TALSN|nr:uncharacterized protein TSTA_011840 [Talaromyces stipitatus ATCC 10500]EED16075.1 hypothetical protein TSTA_011840 [Talaromyces stipitatus ATCC 10500]